jgi:hypothetical protein
MWCINQSEYNKFNEEISILEKKYKDGVISSEDAIKLGKYRHIQSEFVNAFRLFKQEQDSLQKFLSNQD